MLVAGITCILLLLNAHCILGKNKRICYQHHHIIDTQHFLTGTVTGRIDCIPILRVNITFVTVTVTRVARFPFYPNEMSAFNNFNKGP